MIVMGMVWVVFDDRNFAAIASQRGKLHIRERDGGHKMLCGKPYQGTEAQWEYARPRIYLRDLCGTCRKSYERREREALENL